MSPLTRRQALFKGATVFCLLTGGGCVAQSPLSPAEKIMLALSNESSADVVVQFSITSEETEVSEGAVQVSQGAYETVETEIDTTGQYELRIEGDSGFESTYPVQIEEYDLRMGSNLIVEIYDDDTELLIEE